LERLAMYVQGVDNVSDLNFNGRAGDGKISYGDVFLQAAQEYSRHNFEFANTEMLQRRRSVECRYGRGVLSVLRGYPPLSCRT
ncbi:glycine--tRNA ligase subunit alpha, partial [Rhizobium leguminosarum]|uniref:glycine--tRNA ligase subunit alpha n=1 Tax=Rhizobium leguminosarum TaxID=384 RepID=UPI003F986A85